MQTRGAPLIGAVAAYGLALEMRRDPSDDNLMAVHDMLAETRPTAINLRWALARMRHKLAPLAAGARADAAYAEAAAICDEDVADAIAAAHTLYVEVGAELRQSLVTQNA